MIELYMYKYQVHNFKGWIFDLATEERSEVEIVPIKEKLLGTIKQKDLSGTKRNLSHGGAGMYLRRYIDPHLHGQISLSSRGFDSYWSSSIAIDTGNIRTGTVQYWY